MSAVVAAFVGYLALLFVIGYVAARRTKTYDEFLIANRSLGSWVAAISSTSSSESGWIILGACGMAYKDGLGAFWFVPGCLGGYLINWYLVAPALRRHASRERAVTMIDLLVSWFGRHATQLRLTASIIIFLSMMGYVASQMTAASKAFSVLFQWPYDYGVWLGAIVITSYTMMGGFRAVVWTDLLQGVMMCIGLVVLPILALDGVGNVAGLIQKLSMIDHSLVTFSGGETGPALFGMVVGLLGIGLGYPGQPHVLVRYMAIRDEHHLRQARKIALVWGILVFSGSLTLGMSGRVLMPMIEDPEYIFPKLALQLLSPAFAGVMFAAIMAAIMSTADSQLLVAASTAVRDIYEKCWRGSKSTLSDATLMRASRLMVLILGVASAGFAMTETRVIFWFVLFAWSGLGASFGPLVLLHLYWKRVTSQGAIAGMITGFTVTVLWKISGWSEHYIYELVPAFILATLTVIVVSLATATDVQSTVQQDSENQ